MLHISIKAEPILTLGEFHITNSLLTVSIVLLLTFFLGLYYYRQMHAPKKSGLFYLIDFAVSSLYTLMKSVLGDKTPAFFPVLGAMFFFILFQNWFGLVPGVGSILVKVMEHGEETFVPLLRGGTADLNTALMLGLFAFAFIQYNGIKYLGFFEYMKKFFNFRDPISFFSGILELVGEFSKIISFAFRLFGNIFAGEVLLAVIAFLVPVLATFPFLMLEVFVGMIQALVFSMLTAVFISTATAKHH